MSFIFKGSVRSDLDEIKIFIKKILDKLENTIQDKNLIFDLKLILNELIINSVIHGNQCNDNKYVKLFLEIVGDTIRIEVSDEGEGIDFDIDAYNPSDLKCCGRGLVIVDGLSDEVYIDNNRIVAVKYIE
ncbi:ATP-binding protein [Schnuerera sp.]|uniref:ATP-binding protein n=1 Tax=Schnuerera sp. TaxID=2794844 RepID=UPI002BAF9659|nr:ATP-binding protein [Schnuerera sp.]HSH35028.1 ATP-binding protein [Schnuerera sp.]